MKLGFHVSIEGSLDRAVDRAVKLGCDTFQMFTRSPRAWKTSAPLEVTVALFREKLRESSIEPVYGHTPYLLNLSSPKDDVYGKSVGALRQVLETCGVLGVPFVVTHLGSHLGKGVEFGVRRVAHAFNEALSGTYDTMILMEVSAGAANAVGSSTGELKQILELVDAPGRVGVCLDTCHVFAQGYDIRSGAGIDQVLSDLDSAVGPDRLLLVHLNDSVGELGSRIDRHEHIGLGRIGEEGLLRILRSSLARVPMILETPIDERRSDTENLLKVKELARLSGEPVSGS